MKDIKEANIIEEKGILKIIPKKKVDLTKFFDTLELEDDMIENLEDWSKFEPSFLNRSIGDKQ